MAYLNFQNCTRQEYENVIYSQDAKNKIKILFNNVELQDADRYCEKLTVKSRIIPNGAKIFNLNNFISKEADLILHDIDTSIIQNQVSISIGTLVGNSYEYVPIGIFNIENQPTNDKNKTTIKLRDNSVKFDFNYNAQPLIEQNGGVATKLQILQDICSQAGVTCNITSFIGYLDEIGVYDNTITAREYISRIAEQAGKIATINRSGELIFVDLNNLTTWEIPIEVVEKYENGTNFKIGRVVYEDGIVRYETPTSNDDTLFLDGSNNYINGELVKEQASSNNNTYYLQDSGDSELAYLEIEGKTTQETRSGKNLIDYSMINTPNLQDNGYYKIAFPGNKQILNGTFKENTQYTISFKGYRTAIQSGNAGGFNFVYTDGTQDVIRVNTTEPTSKTLTSSSGKTISYIFITWGSTNETYIKDLQLEEGTIATEYEKYGAMPSPDYPSELVSVGYENLYSIENNSSNINVDGQGTLRYGQIIDTNGNNVVVSCENKNNSTTYVRKVTNNVYSGTSVISKTPVLFNNADKIIIFSSSKTEIEKLQNVIITKGTQAHSYIPYGKYGIEVKTNGKNFLNISDGGLGFATLNADGTLTSNITNSYYSLINTKSLNELLMNNLGNTFTFSINKGIPNSAVEIVIYGTRSNGSTYQSSTSSIGAKAVSITVANDFTNITQISFRWNRRFTAFTDTTTIVSELMFEKGSQATTYEEYKLNTYLYTLDNPLRSIGDTKDLLYIKNGMLYVDRKIGSVVLNGSESWIIPWNVNYVHMCSNALTDAKKYSSATKNIICKSNYYPATHHDGGAESMWNLRNNDNYPYLISIVDYGTNAGRITIKNVNITTSTDFKTWLSTHNTEVQYILATPSLEELGVIEVPNTYKEITYIDILSNIDTNSYIQYRESQTQLEAILNEVNQFDIDSLKTGKILGNPAIDSYDLIQITDGNKIFKTLATNDLVYTGVLINTFDTQIGEEAKEQNVFVNGEETFKKWARTTIDNVEGTLTLQAGEINEVNGKLNTTTLQINSQGALLNVLANNSNIDVQYDSEGKPLSGEVREVTTTTGFKFNAEGMTIEDSNSNFKALHRNNGTYYKEGDNVVGQYTKDGSKQKDLELFGVYYYGKNNWLDTPMFVAQLYTDRNGEEAFGHFYNRGD